MLQSPDPALKRLSGMIGTWELRGRTFGATEDNITGSTTVSWLLDGFFIELRGEIEIMGMRGQSIEIIAYDPAQQVFASTVFSNMDTAPMTYYWDVQGDVVTHWTEGSKYTGKFSADGNTLAGGWRPDAGVESNDGNTYDATMTRVR